MLHDVPQVLVAQVCGRLSASAAPVAVASAAVHMAREHADGDGAGSGSAGHTLSIHAAVLDAQSEVTSQHKAHPRHARRRRNRCPSGSSPSPSEPAQAHPPAAGPSGVAPLPGVLPPLGVSAPHEGPGFPALVPIPRQAHWGYPVAGSTVTEAQLKVVGDKGLDPGAMVNAGWWFEPRLPRSASETYRWTAPDDEQMEDWRPGLPSVESEIGPDWPSSEPRTAACASNDLSDHRGDGVQTAKYRPWCSHRHINIISRRC